jgi:hypothetical protein
LIVCHAFINVLVVKTGNNAQVVEVLIGRVLRIIVLVRADFTI